jgi:hypothetical protein
MSLLKIPFKVAVPKPKRNKTSFKRTTDKIVKGKVFQDEDGTYKISINISNDLNPDLLVLDFTERSFDLVGKTNVFSRAHKGRTRFIRNPMNAKFMPGLPEQYIPFAPNWIVKGYIVEDNGIKKFDFEGLVGVDGYIMDDLHSEDD